MAKITTDQIAAAYKVAKAVVIGTMPEAQGVRQLEWESAMRASTASDFIRNLRQMVNGDEYQRTLSIEATNFYLDAIRQDFDGKIYLNALKSLERHLDYYEALATGHKQPGQRKLLAARKSEFAFDQPVVDFEVLSDALEVEVLEASQRPPDERRKRLLQAPKKPPIVYAKIRVFARNADVVAEVRARANGKCEVCNQDAPFLKKSDKSPYLEVHHKVRLADDGEDTVENAIAVCSNCHRKAHYG